MPRRHHRRTRSASSSSSSGASDASASSSASSSGSSDSGSRRRLHNGKRTRWRHKHGGTESGSSSSGSSSSSDDDYGHHKLSKKDKEDRQHLFYAAAGVFVLCLAVALWYSLSNKSSTTAQTASAGGAAGGAGTTTAAGTSKATGGGGTTRASSHGVSTAATTSAGSSKGTATATASAADASNTGPYKLTVAYEGDSFFDGWTFFTDADPTHGQVTYVSQDDAKSAGLISTSATSAIMRVDNTTTLASGANRNSVRITSTDAVKIGSMVIADIVRMPWGCATWPAWWMVGSNWPNNGEIDILEGVNNDDTNQLTLHTKDSNCKQSSDVQITGKLVEANTDCNANNNGNTGCSYAETAANSFGEDFNKAGGGVIVTQFTADAISIWFWSRADIPANIVSGSPDASTWGDPSASWPKSSCDIASYFGDQNLVFDTTLCGDWAGSSGVWSADSTCAAAASSCSDYVADPSHFDEAWWEVGYVRVYSVG